MLTFKSASTLVMAEYRGLTVSQQTQLRKDLKKAGASCKGSVTSLRAKAKRYGGEKGKMYHWCANMKGGKKK